MLATSFAEKHHVTVNTLHVARNTKSIPTHVTWVREHKLYVDEEFFLKRRAFKRKVSDYIHRVYWIAKINGITESYMAKQIGVSLPFINCSMWSIDDSSIMKYKINSAYWKALRWFRRYERELNREKAA